MEKGQRPMFRKQTTDPEFWSRRKHLRDVDLTVRATTEEIQSGSAEGWEALWSVADSGSDDSLWEAFYAGDAPVRREERWLLGV